MKAWDEDMVQRKSKAYDDMASPLALVLGKDISGAPMVADLGRMPPRQGLGRVLADRRAP